MGCSASNLNISRTIVRSSGAIAICSFSLYERGTIRRTWRRLSVDMMGHGERVIRRIFTLNPSTRLLFLQKYAGDELKLDSNIKAHGSRLMHAIGATVDHIEDLDTAMAPLLHELGKRHSAYDGFDVVFFNVFSDATVQIWREQLLGKFKPEVEEAWRQILGYMVARLKEGYHDACPTRPQLDQYLSEANSLTERGNLRSQRVIVECNPQ